MKNLPLTTPNRRPQPTCLLACALALLLAGGAVAVAQQMDGTYNVTEKWTVTLQYDRFGANNFIGTKTFSGTETGQIVVNNGQYKIIDRTGIAWSYPGRDLKARSISDYGYAFHVSGDYVFAPGYGVSAYGLVFMGCFAKKVPLIDGEVPVFTSYKRYSADGSALSSVTGGGYMRGVSLDATVSSTVSFRRYVGPPAIVQQPKSQTVMAGQDATFVVMAGGSPPLTYLWRKGTTPIPGGTGATLVLEGAQFSDAGSYSVVVSNPGGQVTSSTVQLTVNRPPAPWFESWEAAPLGSLAPSDGVDTFVRGDRGRWFLGDTVSSSSSCGPVLSHADIVVENGRKLLKLVSQPNSGGCAENLYVAADTRIATGFPIPLLRSSEISFFEQGWLANPQWNGFFNCIVKPCGDAVCLKLTDDHANQVLYLLQRAPNYVEHALTNTSSGAYLEVFLDPAGGDFSRNLYSDFERVAGTNVGKSIVMVEFDVGSAGWATLDDLRIGPGSGTADTARPVVAFTHPAANARLDHPDLIVRGTARDNLRVMRVWCQLNDGPWTLAQTSNGWTNWASFPLVLEPGTNLLRACAIDTSGNGSQTNSLRCSYVLKDRLTLEVNGQGTVSPNLNGQLLELGKSYSIAALAGAGHVFSNWTGGVFTSEILSTAPVLSFVMRSNLALQANFVPNPFVPAKGAYYGLFYEADPDRGVAVESSGAFSLSLGASGSFSATLRQGASKFPFTGRFNVAGEASRAIPRLGTTPLTVGLKIGPAPNVLSGSVGDGSWTAVLAADKAAFNATTAVAPWKGRYTMVWPGFVGDPNLPEGDSYAWVGVDASGRVNLGGLLADKTPISSLAVPVSEGGDYPLFVPLYKGKGSLLGWLHFDAANPAVAGAASWIKKAQPGAKYYPGGFTNLLNTLGSRYVAPANSSTRVMALTNGLVSFTGTLLAEPFTNWVALGANSRITNLGPGTMTLTNTLSKGAFGGKATLPGTKTTLPVGGVYLQDLGCARGFISGTNQTGAVWLGPSPDI